MNLSLMSPRELMLVFICSLFALILLNNYTDVEKLTNQNHLLTEEIKNHRCQPVDTVPPFINVEEIKPFEPADNMPLADAITTIESELTSATVRIASVIEVPNSDGSKFIIIEVRKVVEK